MFVPMSIRLDASFCAKKLTESGEKLTVFIIQQTFFFSMKELAVFTSISMATV